MKLAAICAALVLIPAVPALTHATVWLELAADPEGNSCEIADPGPNGVVTVYVVMRSLFDLVTGIRFAAPVPTNSGLTHVADVSPFITVGNSQSDISLGLGTCESGTIMLMEMRFVRTSAGDPCTFYGVQRGGIYTDCNFAELPLGYSDGVALNSNGQCNPVPIHNPSPADGATDIPLTTDLNWEDGYYICNAPAAPAGSAMLYFGTTSEPPYVGVITNPHPVGPLLLSTTYYWRIATLDYPYLGSPVWSFTTTEKVAAQTSTWGAIKALYR